MYWIIISIHNRKLVIYKNIFANIIVVFIYVNRMLSNISNIKKIELVGKEEVKKHFKQFKKNKAILIDFGNYNIKYIYAGLFSKKQIKRIFNLLRVNK